MSRPSETRVSVRRFLRARPDEVFAYFTDADALACWFCTDDVTRCAVQSDFTVGGRYCIRMLGPDGELDEHSGQWLEIEPGKRLRLSWSHHDGDPSLVTFDFQAVEGGTWLEVRHEEFPTGVDGLHPRRRTEARGNPTQLLGRQP